MNEMVNFTQGGIPANSEDLIKGLTNVSSNLQGSMGGTPILRLLKAGYYVYGQDSVEVQPGSEWAVNPTTIQHGYACWGDGELLGERMVSFAQKPPVRDELPDYGEPWSQQISMHLQCMSGEDEGMVVVYKGTSMGLRNAAKELINKIVAQVQRNQSNFVPVLLLETDSYQHKKYGEIFFPVLEIVRWISYETGQTEEPQQEQQEQQQQQSAFEQAEKEPEPATQTRTAKPKGRRRRQAVDEAQTGGMSIAQGEPTPEPEPEPTESAAPRRRRRRA